MEHEGTIPIIHVAKRLGGRDISPALTWAKVPEGTAQFLRGRLDGFYERT